MSIDCARALSIAGIDKKKMVSIESCPYGSEKGSVMTDLEIMSGGVSLWTESVGDPTGEPILLIAGAGVHAHFWSDSFCQSFVDKGYFVIRFDHRDCGFSSASSDDYDIRVLAEDVLEILNGYHLTSAHLIGHSMGGYIGQFVAGEYEERVRSLIVISAGTLGETDALKAPYTAEEMSLMHGTWRALLGNRPTEDFESSLEGFLGVWSRLNGGYPLDEARARAYTEELYTRSNFSVGTPEGHMKVMQKVGQDQKSYNYLFDKMRVPILVIQGEEDYLVLPNRGGKTFAQVLPHAVIKVLPKMGHVFFHAEAERKVLEIILKFLSSLQESSA